MKIRTYSHFNVIDDVKHADGDDGMKVWRVKALSSVLFLLFGF